MCGLLRVLFVLTIVSVNCQDIFVPSNEDGFTTQHSVRLPMTLECLSTRHKYIEVRGVTLLNGTDVLIASSLAPNIEQLANEECFATLVQSEDEPAKCEVAMQALPQDDSIKKMDKVVTFDCRKSLGDPSNNEKTISKKKGTINIKCDNKDSVPEILKVSLASGEHVDKVSTNWKCNQENIDNLATSGNGGHCHIEREGYLNDSEMTVKYKCSEPPRRDFDGFVRGIGNRGNGKKGNGNKGNGRGNGK